jgi:hypothetical protein
MWNVEEFREFPENFGIPSLISFVCIRKPVLMRVFGPAMGRNQLSSFDTSG